MGSNPALYRKHKYIIWYIIFIKLLLKYMILHFMQYITIISIFVSIIPNFSWNNNCFNNLMDYLNRLIGTIFSFLNILPSDGVLLLTPQPGGPGNL